jgi:hypothetical protein
MVILNDYNNMNWFEIITGIVSGGTLQYLISSKLMPKKDKKEADAVFIDTLMKRIINI